MTTRKRKVVAVCMLVPPVVAALPVLPDVARLLIVLIWGIIVLALGILMGIEWYVSSASTGTAAVLARILAAFLILLIGLSVLLLGLGMAVAEVRGGGGNSEVTLVCILFGGYLVRIAWSRRYAIQKHPTRSVE